MEKYKEIWTIDKMIMMGIVTKFKGHLIPGRQEYDVVSDCVVRAWHDREDVTEEVSTYFDTVRYVYENDDGTVGYATSQISIDLPMIGWRDQVRFQVLQTIKAPR